MKKLLKILLIIFSPAIVACNINTSFPDNMHDTQAFINIGKAFYKCIGNRDSVNIFFSRFNNPKGLLYDITIQRNKTKILWKRKKPSIADIKMIRKSGRAISGYKLLGIAYHSKIKNYSIIICAEPHSMEQWVTLGHEVLHTAIGAYHK